MKPPAWKPLGPHQRRVLGVLVEKAKTTPAGYPMTVNAIVIGCNQKNNRDPVTAYDDVDVENALRELETLGVVQEIDWLGRAAKYKHLAYEWLGVKPAELAVMAELLLRGAQALGDLRARAARMEPVEDLAALKPIVDGLIERRLMIELTAPGRGQVVSHNLYTQGELAIVRELLRGHAAGHEPAAVPGGGPVVPVVGRDAAESRSSGSSASATPELSAEVAELRSRVAHLERRIERLEAR